MSEEITPYQVVPKTPLAGSAAADIREQGEISRRSFPFVLTLAWVSLTAALGGLASVLGRFMFPNVLFEPVQKFKAGQVSDYAVGEVDERWKDKFGIWLVRTEDAMYALINGSLSGAGGCWTYFLMGSNQLALVNDAGNGVAGVLTPGSAGTMSNSQCSIDGPTSSAVGSGNTLALTLAVTFKASFSGTQTFYGLAVDDANLYNGWKTLGTWTSH